MDHAMRAQALSDAYKEDYLLLVTESLIKAVESRLDKKPGDGSAGLGRGTSWRRTSPSNCRFTRSRRARMSCITRTW